MWCWNVNMATMAAASVSKPLARGTWVIMRAAYKERGRNLWNYDTGVDKLYNTAFIETFRNYITAFRAIRARCQAGMHASKRYDFLAFPDEDLNESEDGDEQQHVFWSTGVGGVSHPSGEMQVISFPTTTHRDKRPAYQLAALGSNGYADAIAEPKPEFDLF